MRRQTLAALALLPALALGAQGCGTLGGSADASGTAKAASDQDKMRKFAQCMRDNGVDMKDPTGDGRVEIRASAAPGQSGGPGQTKKVDGKVEAAHKKCRHLMPNGGKPPKPKPEELAKMRAFSKCMRDNGISEFPDPQPDGGMRIEAGKGTGLNPESQKYQKAQKACSKHSPNGGRGPMLSTGRK
ncbi:MULTISPECIES: hypothetical protein [Actinomadura]|uniref:PT repeat-containing protein n=1 Tax=Actinomadura madurae TaxID=1993 RepID=A0A1I5H6C4_9ACTN|nr:hypothetical protein [Actinomadura madurae]SFO43812.1 hypothetical protein SAMN04489713_10639 [Actinomadura madurae]SPT57566.1 Uncharacterised protein [Actinomadura madurae]